MRLHGYPRGDTRKDFLGNGLAEEYLTVLLGQQCSRSLMAFETRATAFFLYDEGRYYIRLTGSMSGRLHPPHARRRGTKMILPSRIFAGAIITLNFARPAKLILTGLVGYFTRLTCELIYQHAAASLTTQQTASPPQNSSHLFLRKQAIVVYRRTHS